MGQNNSSNLQTRSAPTTPRDKPQSPPPPRPVTPPQIPKVPNYAVPENRVLPIGAQQLPDKRRLLRPVSQELSKFHPDFADIFQYQEDGGPEGKDEAESGAWSGEGPPPSKARANGSAVRDGKENYHMNTDTSSSTFENGGVNSSRFSHTTANGDLNRKPNGTELSRSQSLQEKRSNGHIVMNGHISSNPNGSDVVDRGMSEEGANCTNSLDRSSSSASKRAHKRFPSATTSLTNEASVIQEDPREHLYNHWRQDPFSNPTPAVTSLPMKNTFDLDYKMNLTYAQLAEHRRQKRVADLEDKTGKKLSDLNADLKDKSTVPVSPFDRKNYVSSKPSAPSTATGSSDTGVSKSKKRRAPPPPGAAAARDSSPGRLSLEVEPPADYDLDDPSPPLEAVSPWKPNLSRQNSTASAMSAMSKSSRGSKGPAPVPPPAPPPPSAPVSTPPVSAQSPRQEVDAKPNATPPSGGTPPPKTAPPISSSSARLIAQAKAELEALERLKAMLKDKDPENAKENEAEEKEAAANVCGEGNTEGTDNESKTAAGDVDMEDKEKEREDPAQPTDGKESPMSFSSGDTESGGSSGGDKADGDKGNGVRRLNSLLQHDIVLAAQARSAKGQVKAKTPVLHVKPKDPAELFREELAKAATAREERVKSVESGKEKDGDDRSEKAKGEDGEGAVVFKSDLVKVKRKPVINEVSSSGTAASGSKPSPPPVSPKPDFPPAEAKVAASKSEPDLLYAQSSSKKPSLAALSRQRPPEGYSEDGNTLRKPASHEGVLDLSDDDDVRVSAANDEKTSSSRQFTEDWKPEDDLDSDDEMKDELTYSRSGAVLEVSDGFKSSIIPSRVDDLKSAKRKSSKSGRRESGSSTDERNKFGSIRKFQKSVHNSVRNAFGSISKASGKLLRRNKSHDFGLEDVEGRSYRATREDEGRPKSALTNGVDGHEDMNGHLSESDDDYLEDEEEHEDLAGISHKDQQQVRKMKRAGVAYVGRKGQIVVLPEFETVQVDEEGHVVDDKEDEGRAPRIFKKKKKKFTYESTVRKQEKERVAEQYAEEIREKERQMEFERRKQLEMEREFQRLRDIETQERLQRLQTAQLQQQVNLLQQQQQHLASMQLMQGSSLPSHPHQRYSVPQFTTQHGGLYTPATGLGGGVGAQLPPINMSSYTVQSSPFVTPASTTATTVGGYDVNYLSNYMRMMGIQPPTTQQQWAFLLTNVNGVHPQGLLDTSSKAQALLVGPPGPDLSHLFASKAAPPYTDTSALMAQKASLMNILGSGQLPQTLPADGTVTETATDPTALVTKRLPVSSSSSALPRALAEASAEDLIPEMTERSNPVYFSSDDEEQLARKARQAGQNSRPSSRPPPHPGSSKDRRRPHSSLMPLPTQSNVYRDVTSREEAAVTRVQVPDYRQHNANVVDDVSDDADDSSEDDVSTTKDRVLKSVSGVGGHAPGAVVPEVDGSAPTEDGFRTVQFQHSGFAAGGSRALPPKVYGPMGFKSVAFTPGNPEAKLHTEGSADR